MWAVALFVSFFAVYYGAIYVIEGSAGMARKFKIPSLIIALTIVAFGTSVPEIFIAIVSYFKGVAQVSVGNLLGSSFLDITLVLGVVALIRPIHIKVDFLRKEFPFVIVAGLLIFLLASDGTLQWGDGIILLIMFSIYIYYTLIVELLEQKVKPSEGRLQEEEMKKLNILANESYRTSVFYLIGGLVILAVGVYWMVESAVSLASHFNVPAFIIGITIISLGTVMPELITGIIASIKGEEEIEVGNALGSFIFNLMFIFGFLTLLVQKIDIPLNLLYFEIPLMLAVCVLLIPLMRRNFVLGRLEGALLILIYAIYLSKQVWF